MLHASLWALGSCLLFQSSAAAVKMIGPTLPSAEVAFFRSAAGLVCLVAVWRTVAQLRHVPDPGWHAVRCGLGAVALICFMEAVTTLPLVLIAVVLYARTLLVVPLAQVLLQERATPAVWTAALVGLAGVAVSLWPSLRQPELGWGIAALLGALIASSGSQVAVARLARTTPPEVTIGIYAVAAVVVLGVPAATVWHTPTPGQAGLLLLVGLGGIGAQWAVAHAYRLAGAGRIAPLAYCEIPIAAGLDWLLTSTVPSAHQVGGGLLIIAAAWTVTTNSDMPIRIGSAGVRQRS